MPGDLTKADIPGFAGGGSASTGTTMLTKTWRMALGFTLTFIAIAVGLVLAAKALMLGNRNLGTNISLPGAVQPANAGKPSAWDGV